MSRCRVGDFPRRAHSISRNQRALQKSSNPPSKGAIPSSLLDSPDPASVDTGCWFESRLILRMRKLSLSATSNVLPSEVTASPSGC